MSIQHKAQARTVSKSLKERRKAQHASCLYQGVRAILFFFLSVMVPITLFAYDIIYISC